MKLNVKAKAAPVYTAEGARAVNINAEQALLRSVMACMLWEDTFYESGEDIAKRIMTLLPQVRPEFAAACAAHARGEMKLRHVPLLIVREMARLPQHKALVSRLLSDVIMRPDEITEFLAIYWKDKRQPLSAQVKKGLAKAFQKFNEYALAKYDREGKVRLRDALFLSHSKPSDVPAGFVWTKEHRAKGAKMSQRISFTDKERLYQRLITGELQTPDTWEVALSAGADKKATFERLMAEGRLGALAFLRNLRNMEQAGVPRNAVYKYSRAVDLSWVLPFRFVAAARAVPQWEDICDEMLLRCTEGVEKLPGKTVLIVDVSGSMYGHGNISKRSDMTRIDAAGALAAIARECCEEPRLYATAGDDYTRIHKTAPLPPRRGMALIDLIGQHQNNELRKQLGGGGIFLHQCLDYVRNIEHKAERIIVITDEQDCDTKLKPQHADAFGKYNYLINISVEKNGIAYKPQWVHIDGWSEQVLNFIGMFEEQSTQ